MSLALIAMWKFENKFFWLITSSVKELGTELSRGLRPKEGVGNFVIFFEHWFDLYELLIQTNARITNSH